MSTWKPIPGHEGRYEVADSGEVRSLIHHNGLPVPRPLRPFVNDSGYACVKLSRRDGGSETRRVHHLVMSTFVGPRPDGIEVRHLDGDQKNNSLANLKYGTHSENLLDKRRHGTDHQSTKTHCPQGHPYSDENTYRPKRGGRMCRACRRAQQLAFVARRTA